MTVIDKDKNDNNIFKSIYESCEEGILVSNKTGQIIMANQSAHTIFGYESGELIKQKIEDLTPKQIRSSHKQIRSKYHAAPTPRKMGVGRDLIGVKKNGIEFPLEISLSTVKIGNEVHAMAFVIDIGERKMMEEALRKSEEQLILYATELEQRVKKRTDQLDHTIIKLENSNKELASQMEVRKKAEMQVKKALEKEKELSELKSRFVSMASHEFRTPLSTILSSAALIAKYKTEETHEKRIKHVNKIKTSISNLNHILHDFLSLSKLEEGRIEIDYQHMNLNELVEEVVEELSTFKKIGQEFKVDIKGTYRLILMDRKILKNVLINLMSNATKYSAEHKNIYLCINYNTKNTTIEVKDQGIGISEEDQKHLFQRFFRAKNAINIQGTGLGLNIVNIYMKELKGSIIFKSKLGVGTSFTINLPA